MERHPHTTDHQGFDYMANTGLEEQDRDMLGIVFSSLIIGALTLFQYFGWY